MPHQSAGSHVSPSFLFGSQVPTQPNSRGVGGEARALPWAEDRRAGIGLARHPCSTRDLAGSEVGDARVGGHGLLDRIEAGVQPLRRDRRARRRDVVDAAGRVRPDDALPVGGGRAGRGAGRCPGCSTRARREGSRRGLRTTGTRPPTIARTPGSGDPAARYRRTGPRRPPPRPRRRLLRTPRRYTQPRSRSRGRGR